jgi:hypothetical protein
MTITIEICREQNEDGRSRLRAYVIEELFAADGSKREVRGSDLLVRRYDRVDSAMLRCATRIKEFYVLVDPPKISNRVTADAAKEHQVKVKKMAAGNVAILSAEPLPSAPTQEPDYFEELA